MQGFLKRILKNLKKHRIDKQNKNCDVSIDIIGQNFKKIYETFGLSLNTSFLGSEIDSINKKKRRNKRGMGKFYQLFS